MISSDTDYSHAAHIPVLVTEAIAALAPKAGEVFVDMTFGAGGYAERILAIADTRVFGIDRDPVAIRRAAALREKHADRLTLIEAPFAEIERQLARFGVSEVDGIVFDLGVSSWQLDEAARGFSFRHDGPLDMRMHSIGGGAGADGGVGRDGGAGRDDGAGRDGAGDSGGQPAIGISAQELIEKASEKDLADIFYTFGQERQSRPIARAIVRAREMRAITRTGELVDVIKTVTGERAHEKIHPATRVFQAIRLFVNDELGQLAQALFAAEKLLKPSGRLCLVTFHSLEDRIVKRFFATGAQLGRGRSRHLPAHREEGSPTFSTAGFKPQTPDAVELGRNPRSRSARLRLGIRTDAPARSCTDMILKELGMPRLRLETAFGG